MALHSIGMNAMNRTIVSFLSFIRGLAGLRVAVLFLR